jgi:ABC-type Mn2+/Zn2+ transport system permease subunit
MARAELVLLGAACGPIGVWVLFYRQAFATESMSHGMLPGLVLAVAVGAPLFAGALVGGAVAAATIALVARTPRIGSDVATAVAVGALLGIGELLAVATGTPEHVEDLLFGDPLGAGAEDVVAAALLAVAVAVGVTAGHRPLAIAAFDRGGAPALGVAPGRVDLAVLGGLALTAAVAARGVGALLVLALLLGPAAAAAALGLRLRARLIASALIGAVVGLAGLEAALALELSGGGMVALCAVAAPLIAAVVSPFNRQTPGAPSDKGTPGAAVTST